MKVSGPMLFLLPSCAAGSCLSARGAGPCWPGESQTAWQVADLPDLRSARESGDTWGGSLMRLRISSCTLPCPPKPVLEFHSEIVFQGHFGRPGG